MAYPRVPRAFPSIRNHTRRALGTNAVEFLQALRGLRDDIEDLGAKGPYEFAGKVRTSAFDHAGAEVFLDMERGRRLSASHASLHRV